MTEDRFSKEDFVLRKIEKLLVCMELRNNWHKVYFTNVNGYEFALSTRSVWNSIKYKSEYEVEIRYLNYWRPFFNPTAKQLFEYMDDFAQQQVLQDVMET